MIRIARAVLLGTMAMQAAATQVELSAPASAPRYDLAEFVVRVQDPPQANPFTDTELTARFTPAAGPAISVLGFVDSQDGSLLRLRFCPHQVGTYDYEIALRGAGLDRRFTGQLQCEPSPRDGPVVVDPEHPKHFVRAGSGRPFYHLGYTAYHLLDPSNDEAQIDATIDYCAREGFNKIRFLLTGYPRDSGPQTTQPGEYGVTDATRLPNYGSRPGQVNPLPAWPGQPHRYDFSRFNVAYWQRADRAVRRMREQGIVATCIVAIEKQDLPDEYGRLTEAEYRLYRYAVSRLAAFDNVWWDLGNEHNEYRDVAWGNTMGAFVKRTDPYGRLTSAHAYKEFLYSDAPWADFIITQQYGQSQEVYDWALKYVNVPKPYVNEEYGYEGESDRPGHGQNVDRVRRSHWSIALASGYATYGDHSKGVAWFYMGEPGPGKAAVQLKHLRACFEALPFREMTPDRTVSQRGFCLAKLPSCALVYLPAGGQTGLNLPPAGTRKWAARWFDPRTGERRDGPAVEAGKTLVHAPDSGDWALILQAE